MSNPNHTTDSFPTLSVNIINENMFYGSWDGLKQLAVINYCTSTIIII